MRTEKAGFLCIDFGEALDVLDAVGIVRRVVSLRPAGKIEG
jgi:hypothetical protein